MARSPSAVRTADRRRLARMLGAALLALAATPAPGQEVAGQMEVREMTGHLAIPAQQPFTEERMRRLAVPPGFAIQVFALDLRGPRMLAVGPDGTVYVSEYQADRVTALKDTDGDGAADQSEEVASGLATIHGLAVGDGQLYMATTRQVLAAPIGEDGSLGEISRLIADLPEGGQHGKRTIGVGPDGNLYISVGSLCNACEQSSRDAATLVRAEPNGATREVYARGLRNMIGFDWHPQSRELWGMDNGADWRGDDLPPEELNRIEQGADYGWPWCYGMAKVDLLMPGKPQNAASHQAYCDRTEPAALVYDAHAAPAGMAFYDGEGFPDAYRGDAFVAMHGSWNRNPPTGYKIVRIDFEGGQPTGFEDFVTGFLAEDGASQFGRPAGVAVAADGALLFTDDANGLIYRVSYVGE